MTDRKQVAFADGIYVVAATKEAETCFWAVASPVESVLAEVAAECGAGWTLAMTTRRVTVEKAAALGMPLRSIRRIGSDL